MSTTVLLADREPVTRGFLERHLRHDGFEIVAGSGRRPDLVIAGDDAELERWCGEAPVIVLGSPEAEPDDRVLAFRRGATTTWPRPFHYEELVERIRAVLRRSQPPQRLVVGPIEIDLYMRIVSVAGTPIALSQKEYALLVRLASDPKRVFTKDELLRDVWGYGLVGAHPDARLARLPAAAKAARARPGDVVHREPVGRRLPAARPAQEG